MDKFEILETYNQKLWQLSEVKNYLRISHDYDDILIEGLLGTAIDIAETFTKLSILERKIHYINECIGKNKFELKYRPASKITKIQLQDKELEKEQYRLEQDSVLIIEGDFAQEKLTVEYIAGFGDKVPLSIKHGILLHVASMYDREESASSLSPEIQSLYLPYRRWEL